MNNNSLIFLSVIFGATAILYIVIRFSLNRWENSYDSSNVEMRSNVRLLKRLLLGFTVLMALFMSSYAFFTKDMYATINKNFERTIWIGLVSISTVLANSIMLGFFDRRIESNSIEDGSDPTTYKFLKYFVSTFIYLFGLIFIAYSFPSLRVLAHSALAGAGVIAVIIGVAAQEAFSNIIGGIFIVIFKPFRVGDTIRVGETTVGRVEDLTLRHTVINNFQNKRIVIPNAVMNKESITNYNLSERKICEWVEIGVSYDANVEKALQIMQEEAEKHPFVYDNRTENEKNHNADKITAKVIGFGESSVNLRAWVWARNYPSGFSMRMDLYQSIKKRFDEEDIEIPFPYRTIVFKNTDKEKAQKEFRSGSNS